MIAKIQIEPDFIIDMDYDYDTANSILNYSTMAIFNRGKRVKDVSVDADSFLLVEYCKVGVGCHEKYIPISDFSHGVTSYGNMKNLISNVYYDKKAFDNYIILNKKIRNNNSVNASIYTSLEILIKIEYTNLINETKIEYFIASPYGLSRRIPIKLGNQLQETNGKMEKFKELSFDKLNKLLS